MDEFRFEAENIDDTERLGRALANTLPSGSVVALLGTLGAGKTRLVQAIAANLGIEREQVVSPTFVLCQQYPGRRTIYHLDAYRLHDDDEFLQLGPEEFFESDGITLIEWADKVHRCLPPEHLELEIAVTGSNSRTFSVRSIGMKYDDLIDSLRRQLF